MSRMLDFAERHLRSVCKSAGLPFQRLELGMWLLDQVRGATPRPDEAEQAQALKELNYILNAMYHAMRDAWAIYHTEALCGEPTAEELKQGQNDWEEAQEAYLRGEFDAEIAQLRESKEETFNQVLQRISVLRRAKEGQ